MTDQIQRIRWVAASLVFVAIVLHAFDVYPAGPMVHLVGATIWTYTGIKTKEGPIILNFLPQIPIWASGLIWYFFL